MTGFQTLTIGNKNSFSVIGAFVVMSIYIWFFRPKKNQRNVNLNMNYLIGAATAIISVLTLLKIIRTMQW